MGAVQVIASSQLGRMLSAQRSGGGVKHHLSDGEVEKRLNGIGKSTRVKLDPELLRQVLTFGGCFQASVPFAVDRA